MSFACCSSHLDAVFLEGCVGGDVLLFALGSYIGIHVRKCFRLYVCERGLKKGKDGEKERGKKDMCVREADERRFLIVIALPFLLCIFGGFTH